MSASTWKFGTDIQLERFDFERSMDDNDNGSPPPLPIGRSVDIELPSHEIITIDLDRLDPNPEDVIDLLDEAVSHVNKWSEMIWEYWKSGLLDGAETIAQRRYNVCILFHSVVQQFN